MPRTEVLRWCFDNAIDFWHNDIPAPDGWDWRRDERGGYRLMGNGEIVDYLDFMFFL